MVNPLDQQYGLAPRYENNSPESVLAGTCSKGLLFHRPHLAKSVGGYG